MALHQKARRYSLIRARQRSTFDQTRVRPPLNPLLDCTPMTVCLDHFVSESWSLHSILHAHRIDSRVVNKLDTLIRCWPSWSARQPRSKIASCSFASFQDVASYVKAILVAKYGEPERDYLEFTMTLTPWVHAIFVGLMRTAEWHPQNIYHSALFYSTDFCGKAGRRAARKFLPRCWTLPSLCDRFDAEDKARTRQPAHLRKSDDHDIRTFFKTDLSSYGRVKTFKAKRKVKTSEVESFSTLPLQPQCSQTVIARARRHQTKRKFAGRGRRSSKSLSV